MGLELNRRDTGESTATPYIFLIYRMITSPAIIVLMSLLALSIEKPMAGYNYAVPDNPLVLPKRRTTTSKPEKEAPTTTTVAYSYPVPEDPLVLQRKENNNVNVKNEQEVIQTYQYPVPENPLQIPRDLPICGTDQRTGESPDVVGVNCKASKKEDDDSTYQYPVPENPLVLPTKDHRQIKILIDDEDFQINLEELPDFNPEAFPDLVEAERSHELVPAPLTTPKSTFVQKVVVVLEPAVVLVKSCHDMKDELPQPSVNCFEDDSSPELATVSEELKAKPIVGLDFNLAAPALFPSDDSFTLSRIIPRKK